MSARNEALNRRAAVESYLEAGAGRFEVELKTLIRVPSVSTQPAHNADTRKAAELDRPGIRTADIVSLGSLACLSGGSRHRDCEEEPTKVITEPVPHRDEPFHLVRSQSGQAVIYRQRHRRAGFGGTGNATPIFSCLQV